MEKYAIYAPRLIKKKEKFAPGHRACIGCGEALAVRLAFKALGNNIVVANATGCMEIVASQIPYTSQHSLFAVCLLPTDLRSQDKLTNPAF